MKQLNNRLWIAVLIFFVPFFLCAETDSAQTWGMNRDEEFVSIYDDFDDGSYGRSEYRSVFRTVKMSAFARTKTHPVASPAWEETSHLTAVVLSSEREEEIRQGAYSLILREMDGVYYYSRDGVNFSFTLEKAGEEIRAVLEGYYQGRNADWLEPVWNHYQENYIIRIHSAENIFEPWREVIQYREAILMATLLGDRDQWLWGIHDGSDILKLP
ncbi:MULTISPECIES: hypothetical protein [unclassified Oceanispirochaeta]|uniref:hypothetical protein n=1 Tax=unclassified Oceanispirochaeta TaxID=2635722 RepID=UPI000E091947|nr:MULTISPECIES: hypothetical protein [unclassified Oceanispirochaeta]MBF9015495.1 hypothetical protein [Oceanispirochaeta sp. M2]NPD71954.1 hypothetical protein [Oceanispirochaeta sp. M1]RDG32761.1 hypothetical protein DV872_07570 [Oceanispirochaeta sp. M1]